MGQGSCNGEGKPVPLSHPFEIQVQGHEPREEWQRGPAPGQTGSHRTGPPSSSPRLAPSHPSPPRLAQAYGSQAADPQWTGRSPTLLSPISEPLLISKQQQHPPGRDALQRWGVGGNGGGVPPLPHSSCTQASGWGPSGVCC